MTDERSNTGASGADDSLSMPGPTCRIEQVIAEERSTLGLKGNEQADALCLSGGGIRSATFSLGVLQGLAKRERLRKFHYLSTVSGGGYIGLWLAAWISRVKGNIGEVETALAGKEAGADLREAGAKEPKPIKRLRAYSNFLSPVHGLSADSVAIVAILVRNLLLHWAMVLPIMLSVLLLPRMINTFLYSATEVAAGPLYGFAAACFLLAIGYASWDSSRTLVSDPGSPRVPVSHFSVLFAAPILLGAFAVVVAALNNEAVGINTPPTRRFVEILMLGAGLQVFGALVGRLLAVRRLPRKDRRDAWNLMRAVRLVVNSAASGAVASAAVCGALYVALKYIPQPEERTTFAVPMVLAALGLASVVRAGLSMRWTGEDVREWWGRASGVVAVAAIGWMLLSLLVIQLPTWLLRWAATWSGWTAGAASIGGIALAIGTAAAGFWSKHGSEIKEKAANVSQTLGMRTMEIAALVSVIVIALTASLMLGLLVTQGAFVKNAAGTESELKRLRREESCLALSKLPAAKDGASAVKGDCVFTAVVATPSQEADKGKNEAPTAATAAPKPTKSTDVAANGATANNAGDKPQQSQQQTVCPAATKPCTMSGDFVLLWLAHHRVSLQSLVWWAAPVLMLAFVVVAIVFSMLFGANAFSLNSFYGNRLTRAFLGASRPKDQQHPHPFTGFDRDDNVSLKDLAPVAEKEQSGARLLPIINTALNLVRPSGDRLEWQERKAASFFMSPYFCGGDLVGFVPTASYANRKNGVSVGRAMSISGAAASPSMGYHSSPLVSLLLAFFNMRLGWWMPNPNCPGVRHREEPRIGIGPVVSEMISTTGETTRYVYLSDGGHFENLGLYEMVRRGCRRIIVVDAGCDPDYQYEDLENAVRKIRVDFGIRVKFPELLRPDDARKTQRHYCLGRICYSEQDKAYEDGLIVLIKPVLSGDEPVDVRRYAESTRSNGRVFPQQPTSDQFFDEAQFESYRELGLHSLEKLFLENSGEWPPLPPDEDKGKDSVAAAATATVTDSVPGWAPPAPPPPSGGLFAGLASLGTWGQVAALATITAAVTVTGTVALNNDATVKLANSEVTLKDSTVRLSPDTSTLTVTPSGEFPVKLQGAVQLQAGTTVKLDPETTVKLDPDTMVKVDPDTTVKVDFAGSLDAAAADDRVKERFAQFAVQLREELQKGEFKVQRGADADVETLKKIVADTGSLIGRLDRVSNDLAGSTDAFVKELRPAVESLKNLVAALNNPDSGLMKVLDNMLKQLRFIDERVRRVSPRETVRGGQ